MKYFSPYFQRCYFLFLISIASFSCNFQGKPNSSEKNQEPKENLLFPVIHKAPQIAEYVVEIYEDKKGHLWFGTMSKGTARYDGKSLTYFSTDDGLCGNTVWSFAEDNTGHLWFGTHTGLCKFDGTTYTNMWNDEMWNMVDILDQRKSSMGVHTDKIGNIWTSTYEGIFRYDGSTFTKFNLPIDKSEIASYSITKGKASLKLEDSEGNLWFGTDGYGAFKYDGDSFIHFTKKDGLCNNNITSILEDNLGNIWFACVQSSQPSMTGDGGLCRFNGDKFTHFPDIKGLFENDIYTLYKDRSGKIWIGALGHGVYCYDGKDFELYNETDQPDLLKRFGLQSVLEDRNGVLWFGFSGGLFRLNGKRFMNVTQDGPWK